MRLTLIQMNSRTASRNENVERACAFVDEAAHQNPDIVVLPEFFNTEYFPQYRDYRYMDYAEADDGFTQTRMKEKARQHGFHIVSTIFEIARPGLNYDTAMLISPQGEIVGKYRKVHPAAYLSLEKIYFRGGSSFPVFRVGDWTVGFSTCYDNLFPESCRCLMLHGAELQQWKPQLGRRRCMGPPSVPPPRLNVRQVSPCRPPLRPFPSPMPQISQSPVGSSSR